MTTTGLSGYNVYLYVIEEGIAFWRCPLFVWRSVWAVGPVMAFSPSVPSHEKRRRQQTAGAQRGSACGPWAAPYLLGAIQNLRSGKLTMTASKVLTTEAMVEANAASMPKEPWQNETT